MALAGTWPRLGPGSRVAGKGCGGGTGTNLCPGHELQQQQTFREHGRAGHRAVSAGCYFIRPAPDAPSTRISSSWFCTEDAEPREANPITEEKRGRLGQSALQPEPPTSPPSGPAAQAGSFNPHTASKAGVTKPILQMGKPTGSE